MEVVNIDTTRRDNFRLTFDKPVETLDAIRFVADIYKKGSGDETVKVQRPSDVVRDNDGTYAIVDGTRRCALFEMGGLEKEPARLDHYVYQYHASDGERELLIRELEQISPN